MNRFYTGNLTSEKMMENIIDEKISELSAVATSGLYTDLLNTPTIPTVPANVSAFTNDAGYLTQHQDLSGYVQTTRKINNNALSADITLSANDVSAVPNTNFISGGTVTEGKFSELPAFIAGLAGKFSNGTVTYKISQDETIDATVLTDTYGSVAIPVPQWNIPEVIIDGNEKTITITSLNPYVPPVAFAPSDFNMATGTLVTNLNSKYQVIKIKNITIIGSGVAYNILCNSADMNLKLDSCSIISATMGGCVYSVDGYVEAYYSKFESTYSGEGQRAGLISSELGKIKSFSNTYKNMTETICVQNGGQVQAISDSYTNCINAVKVKNGGSGTLYTSSSVTGDKVVNDGTIVLGGISYK